MAKTDFQSIDEYIETFPKEVQQKLQKIREVVRKAAPNAEEAISYQMPTFKLNGNLVHFAAFKNHIGLYPAPSGISAFESEIKDYKHAKGSMRFPLDQPIPFDLIAKIVKFRVQENSNKKKRNEQ
ncbi:DUF1801 domain-containing protein [Gracilimonas sp.]|uniref:iron chaperone n=1 Tax=Gracilimonas sp. TaxID=1974203 RepID=UPI0032EC3DA1